MSKYRDVPERPGALGDGHSVLTAPLLLFALVAGVQLAHNVEHVAQVVQVHLLGTGVEDAHGIVSALDRELVHFVWNTAILASLLVLLDYFGTNRGLRVAAWVTAWHVVEHTYLVATLSSDGTVSPGLLAHGGALAGGLPISRADLHLVYNLAETVPLVAGVLVALRAAFRQRRPFAPRSDHRHVALSSPGPTRSRPAIGLALTRQPARQQSPTWTAKDRQCNPMRLATLRRDDVAQEAPSDIALVVGSPDNAQLGPIRSIAYGHAGPR